MTKEAEATRAIYSDFMLDLETLSTEPNAATVSVALYPFRITNNPNGSTILFDFDKRVAFYRKISVTSLLLKGKDAFHIDENTLKWWDQQNEEAKHELLNGEMYDLKQVLTDLLDYIHVHAGPLMNVQIKGRVSPQVRVWGNSARFDIQILWNALKMCGLKPNFPHSLESDYRTFKHMFSHILPLGGEESALVAHHPVDDCYKQIVHLNDILSQLAGYARTQDQNQLFVDLVEKYAKG